MVVAGNEMQRLFLTVIYRLICLSRQTIVYASVQTVATARQVYLFLIDFGLSSLWKTNTQILQPSKCYNCFVANEQVNFLTVVQKRSCGFSASAL